jgi:hypothetical protein
MQFAIDMLNPVVSELRPERPAIGYQSTTGRHGKEVE